VTLLVLLPVLHNRLVTLLMLLPVGVLGCWLQTLLL
jgi:hypothetical protein